MNAPATFRTKREADRWLAGEDTLIGSGQWVPPRDRKPVEAPRVVTVSAWADAWVEAVRVEAELGTKSWGTHRAYKSSIKPFVKAFKDLPLGDVTVSMVEDWWAALGEDGNPYTGRALALETRRSRYRVARACMLAAVKQGLIPESPMRVAGASGKSVRGKPLRFIPSPQQVRELCALVPAETETAVTLAYWCGLRSGEVRALDFNRLRLWDTPATVTVDRTVVRRAEGGDFVSRFPKTDASHRTLLVPERVAGRLRELHVQPEVLGRLVIPSRWDNMRPMRAETLLEPFHVAREQLEWDPSFTRLHDLRAAFLTRVGREGATVRELMELGGHADQEAVMRYQIATRDRDGPVGAKSLSESILSSLRTQKRRGAVHTEA